MKFDKIKTCYSVKELLKEIKKSKNTLFIFNENTQRQNKNFILSIKNNVGCGMCFNILRLNRLYSEYVAKKKCNNHGRLVGK